MSDIWELHNKAFAQVSAYVVLANATEPNLTKTPTVDRVATIAFRHPRDGAGRLWCYLHVLGAEPVRGYAGGFGYDKKSAAAAAAARRLPDADSLNRPEITTALRAIKEALRRDDGHHWDWHLEHDAGFRVLQAV